MTLLRCPLCERRCLTFYWAQSSDKKIHPVLANTEVNVSFTWPVDELVLDVYLPLTEFPLLQKLLLCCLQVWKFQLFTDF